MKFKSINRRIFTAWFGLASATGLGVNAHAMQEIFMDIEGIPGESVSAAYADYINVISASGNFSRRGCGDFLVSKYVDRATPALIASVVGRVFAPEVNIFYVRTGEVNFEYMRLTLHDVLFTELNSFTDIEEVRAVEQLSMNAGSMTINYTPQTADGSGDTDVVEEITCRKR